MKTCSNIHEKSSLLIILLVLGIWGCVVGQNLSLTPESLKNAEFSSEWTTAGKARLNDGRYAEAAAPGSATKTTILLSDKIALGDLNNDGKPDAAVVLIIDTGGSGTFRELAVLRNRGGKPVHIASTLLGDRIRVNSIAITSGAIVVDLIRHGSQDPMCCPTQKEFQKYILQEDTLVRLD